MNRGGWIESILPFRVEKPKRFYYFCERLLIFTPDLLRKSAPEGLVDNISVAQTLSTPREWLPCRTR